MIAREAARPGNAAKVRRCDGSESLTAIAPIVHTCQRDILLPFFDSRQLHISQAANAL